MLHLKEVPSSNLAYVESATLFFDQDCGFCRWSVKKILAWDRRHMLRPVPIQDPEADVLLAHLDTTERMESWHLVTPDGKVYSGGAAVPPLMKLLPGGSPVGALASTFPRSTDRLYRWVARHRGRLGSILGPKACSL